MIMESGQKNRQYNLDLLKALAIICMVFSHSVLVFAVNRNGWEEGFYVFLGDVILGDYIAVAHAFMLAMGVGIVFSARNDPASLIRRGIKIFLAGYVLNFCRRGVYCLIMDLVHKEISPVTGIALFSSDIFQFAGLALIVTGLLFKLKLNKTHILIIGILLSIIGSIIPPLETGNFVLDTITGNFIFSTYDLSCFVLCSWYIFVAVGIFFGSVLKTTDDKDRLYKRMLWFGLVAAVYIISSFVFGPFYLSPDNEYYRVGTVDAAGLLSMDFFALALFYFVIKKTGAEKFSVFIEMSRNITLIYVIHWCILGLTDFICCELLGFVFTYPVMYAYGAFLLVISFLAARLCSRSKISKILS